MTSWAGQWTQIPSATPLQTKNDMLIFVLRSTSDDWPDWSMDSNPICNLSPTKNMKCLFMDYVQLLMISQAGQRTWIPSATSFQPTKWNARFGIMFNFCWSAGLVDGLKPHLSPLSNQKNEMLVFSLCSTSDDQPGWSMDSNPICHPSQAKKMKCSFLYYIQLLMIGRAGHWTQTPSTWPLKPKKNEMLIFGLHLTSDDQPGWSMDSNPICKLFPTNKMKCSFWYYVQLLMISRAGQWTQTPSATPLQPKKWNACFCIMFNFWWLARLVDGLEPHLPPLSRHKIKCSFLHYIQLVMIGRAGQWTQTPSATPLQPKNEMLIFGLLSISGDQPSWSMHSNPIHHPSPAKKCNAYFWITFNFWWSIRLVNGLEPHLPPLSNQKNDMLIFGLRSTSYDWPGWSMDLNPICHPSPAKKMKWSSLDYVQFLMIGQAGRRTPTPSATSFQPKNEMLIFVLRYSSDDQPGWSMDSKPIHHPSSQKNEMLIFVLRSTSDDWRGWLMDSNCIHYPSPAKKMKCSFLDYF